MHLEINSISNNSAVLVFDKAGVYFIFYIKEYIFILYLLKWLRLVRQEPEVVRLERTVIQAYSIFKISF